MFYASFIIFIQKLLWTKKIFLSLEMQELCIESSSSHKEKWKLSTVVFRWEEKIPSFVSESLSSVGIFRWQERGAYLELDPSQQAVLLIYESAASLRKYSIFKKVVHQFLELAAEWKRTFKPVGV